MALTISPRVTKQHYASPDGVTRRLAEALGRSIGGTHQLLDGPTSPFARVERVLQIAVASGHTAWAATRVERFARLVRQARVPYSAALALDAQTADLAEDVAETNYHLNPSPDTRDEWVRTIDKSVLRLLAVRDALVGGR
jgi:hypothetical protein